MRKNTTYASGFSIAIIGGGFTGAMLASQLLRRAHPSLSVVLIERAPRLARGVAYGTQEPAHLLNVAADNMSALADDPGHFLRWAQLNFDSGVQPCDFLPRRVYGQYLGSVLEEAAESTAGQLITKRDEVVRLSRIGTRAEIILRNRERLFADKVVLALGNYPPGQLPLPGIDENSTSYVPNPWSADALDSIPPDGEVLLVGSGLTSVDMMLALRAHGFHGTIHMLPRHGLLPQRHKTTSCWHAFWNETSACSARGLLRLVRENVKAAERQGIDWRAVIDSLRPYTQKIWHALPFPERRRFLRYLRAYWDVHRHRIAPELGRILDHQRGLGKIQAHAGRITNYRETDTAEVAFLNRQDGSLRTLRVDRVINCTGPEGDCRKITSPLLANLLRDKLVRPDPLFLGLDSAKDGAVIDAAGAASDLLYTAGPSRKGTLWETVAVPEIRAQVSELAGVLLETVTYTHGRQLQQQDQDEYSVISG